MIGTSIAHYKITGKIGAGGMGEVWRATDTKLTRDVALKILPEVFSRDAQRMTRFQREAQVLASLNHPHIAAIYGTEDFDGRRVLVLELVEGQDLHQRLAAGLIPLDESLEIARQIAEALEAAHERGVVHRDLKPANVKLTPGGEVKVLDFGLAKALEGGDPSSTSAGGEPSLSPTLTAAATQAGVILGTAAYMSPEQAKGKPVDRRADIFSYGALLFEMLARKQPFAGETVSETLASVMKDEPAWEALPAGTPPAVAGLLRRCLEKDPRRRLRDIGEARITLENVQRGEEITLAGVPAATVHAAPGSSGGRRISPALWLGIVAAAAAAAGILGWQAGSAPGPPPEPRVFSIETEPLTLGFTGSPALSPDGRKIAYVAGGRIWIRHLSDLEVRRVEGGEGGRGLFWSPDSASLGFAVGSTLHTLDLASAKLSDVTEMPFDSLASAAWGPDGTLYLAANSGALYTVPVQGGEARPLFEMDRATEFDFHNPSILPGGGLIYIVHKVDGGDVLEAFLDGERREIHRMGERVDRAALAPGGAIVYQRVGAQAGLWALPLDLETLEVTGEPVVVALQRGYPSVSRDGALLAVEGGSEGMTRLVWVDRSGGIVEEMGEEVEGIRWPRLSPDGRRVSYTQVADGKSDAWLLDLETDRHTRLTFFDDSDPVLTEWHPAGERIAVTRGSWFSFRTFTLAADGSDTPEPLLDGSVPSFTRDGRLVAFMSIRSGETGLDILIQDLEGGGDPVPFLATEDTEALPRLSPDGTYLAFLFVPKAASRGELFLRKFPEGTGKWQISNGGAGGTVWRRDGKEILWLDRDPESASLWSATVELKPRVRIGRPVRLFGQAEHPALRIGGRYTFDVSPEGDRFLMVKRTGSGEEEKPARLILALDWQAAHLAGRAR